MNEQRFGTRSKPVAIEPDEFPEVLYSLLCDAQRGKNEAKARTDVETLERHLIQDIRERERIREEREIPKVGT